MAPLQLFALEFQRHHSKHLEVGTSSLASIAAGVDVDLDARREMLLAAKLGKSDDRKPSRPLHHLHHHLRPLLFLLGAW